jgi:mannose-1-phosphate guanylyltransferase
MTTLRPLMLCGGVAVWLWPVSRHTTPKQITALAAIWRQSQCSATSEGQERLGSLARFRTALQVSIRLAAQATQSDRRGNEGLRRKTAEVAGGFRRLFQAQPT